LDCGDKGEKRRKLFPCNWYLIRGGYTIKKGKKVWVGGKKHGQQVKKLFIRVGNEFHLLRSNGQTEFQNMKGEGGITGLGGLGRGAPVTTKARERKEKTELER